MKLTKYARDIAGRPHKYCPVCRQWLPATKLYFSESKRHASGYLTYCKDCCGDIQRRKREKERAAGSGTIKTDMNAQTALAEILKPEYWLTNSDNYQNKD